MRKQKISGGVYVVVDPAMQEAELLDKLQKILPHQPAAIQIWDHFRPGHDQENFCKKVVTICRAAGVPVLVNNNWKLAKKVEADGVHFDEIPFHFQEIKQKLNPGSIIGLTLNNNLNVLKNVDGVDYISFCSMFNSPSSNSCELVDFETVKQARQAFDIPIFLSGGITPESIPALEKLDFDGVAVISGIMSAQFPDQQIETYKKLIENEK